MSLRVNTTHHRFKHVLTVSIDYFHSLSEQEMCSNHDVIRDVIKTLCITSRSKEHSQRCNDAYSSVMRHSDHDDSEHSNHGDIKRSNHSNEVVSPHSVFGSESLNDENAVNAKEVKSRVAQGKNFLPVSQQYTVVIIIVVVVIGITQVYHHRHRVRRRWSLSVVISSKS